MKSFKAYTRKRTPLEEEPLLDKEKEAERIKSIEQNKQEKKTNSQEARKYRKEMKELKQNV